MRSITRRAASADARRRPLTPAGYKPCSTEPIVLKVFDGIQVLRM